MISGFLFVALALLTVWVFLLLLSPDTRKEQLLMSVIGLVLSPGALLIAAGDYRSGRTTIAEPIGLEDLLFAFALFGIASVIYHVILAKRGNPLKKSTRLASSNTKMNWIAHLLVISGVWLFTAMIVNLIFLIPTIQAFIVGGLLVGVYIVAERHDLLSDALLSGLFTAAIVFLAMQLFFIRMFPEAALGFWNLDNLSGILLGGIPLEEVLWAAVVGFTVGPLFEYLRRLELR